MAMHNSQLREWFSREEIPIEELAKMWIQLDKNDATSNEIQTLLGDPDTHRKELEERLRQRIQFGTAGIFLVNRIKYRP
jgi:hypothetical protein